MNAVLIHFAGRGAQTRGRAKALAASVCFARRWVLSIDEGLLAGVRLRSYKHAACMCLPESTCKQAVVPSPAIEEEPRLSVGAEWLPERR